MDRELVEKFMEVTGEGEATAQQYLALADGNVEMAISLMFEEGRSNEPAPQQTSESEPPVRPPILPTQEVLVPPEPVCSFPRLSNNVFDRFRDFAVETQRQEEEMTRRVTGIKQISQRKSKRLEDLFRPPCNILFLGSFIEAREHAKSLNRWLLVNVQNPQEFACQILNRDVWPNSQVQEIVKDHFVLWQVLSNTADGKRYIDFYNVNEYPYLAIVDPRTGECMRTYCQITVDILMSGLNDMLSTHPSPESAMHDSPTSERLNSYSAASLKRNSATETVSMDCSSSSSSEFKYTMDRLTNSAGKSDMAPDESSINLNIPSSSNFNIISKKRRLEELELKDKQNECASPKPEEGLSKLKTYSRKPIADDEPLLRLCLRLPNGGKETISMCATDTIEDFLGRMDEMGFPSIEHTYLVSFPKTNVGALSPNMRLLDTILFPSNTVFITKI